MFFISPTSLPPLSFPLYISYIYMVYISICHNWIVLRWFALVAWKHASVRLCPSGCPCPCLVSSSLTVPINKWINKIHKIPPFFLRCASVPPVKPLGRLATPTSSFFLLFFIMRHAQHAKKFITLNNTLRYFYSPNPVPLFPLFFTTPAIPCNLGCTHKCAAMKL